MRVLMLSWEYPPHVEGGLGHHVMSLAPALCLADRSLELHVITPSFGPIAEQPTPGLPQAGPEPDGQPIVTRVPIIRPETAHYYESICRANEGLERSARELLAARGPFDLLHAHDWLVGSAARALQVASGVPLLTTMHATERGRNRGHLVGQLQVSIDAAERHLARKSQGIIVCSQAMRAEVQNYFQVTPDRVHVVPNGVELKRFDYLRHEDLTDFRLRFARPDEVIVFNIGRLVYEKGADLLVEAAPMVLSQIPAAKFVIGGRGPMLSGLKQRVQDLGLADKVLLTGFLSDEDRDRLYLAADCCVFPSRYEPFGIVALESMAAGTPVVVAGVNGLGSVVTHEQTGITVLADNVESLAWGITRTLRDPESASQRAQEAYQAVLHCFNWEVLAGMTLDLYRQLAA